MALQLLTLSEAAEQLACTPKTVRRLIATGRIPGYKLGTSAIRVDAADLEKLLTRVPTGGRWR